MINPLRLLKIKAFRLVLIAGAAGALVLLGGVWILHPQGPAVVTRVAKRPAFLASIRGEKSCEGCHAKLDPGIDRAWRESVHFRTNVGCASCHGVDHEAIFKAKGKVSAGVCGECHEDEVKAFAGSGHADAELAAISDARFLAQSSAMQEEGCMGCHSIGSRFADGSVGGCNECHAGHEFSAAAAREPEACEVCHGGPDHPVMEAYKTSVHGVLYYADRDAEKSPSCVTCHMPDGDHGHVANLTLGQVFQGAVPADEYFPFPMKRISRQEMVENRQRMLQICGPCHSTRFARESLERADQIKRESDALVAEAYAVIVRLHEADLLDPMPLDRAPNPLSGHALELGANQLYENTSEIEQAFFRMFKFHQATTFKAAYHHSPDWTHWEGVVPMKMELDKIHSEDRRLRRTAGLRKPATPPRSGAVD